MRLHWHDTINTFVRVYVCMRRRTVTGANVCPARRLLYFYCVINERRRHSLSASITDGNSFSCGDVCGVDDRVMFMIRFSKVAKDFWVALFVCGIIITIFFFIIIIIIIILCLERYVVNASACYIDWTPQPPPPSADKDVIYGRGSEQGRARGVMVLVLPRCWHYRSGGGGVCTLPAKNRHDEMPPVRRGSNVQHNIWPRATYFCGRRSSEKRQPTKWKRL